MYEIKLKIKFKYMFIYLNFLFRKCNRMGEMMID